MSQVRILPGALEKDGEMDHYLNDLEYREYTAELYAIEKDLIDALAEAEKWWADEVEPYIEDYYRSLLICRLATDKYGDEIHAYQLEAFNDYTRQRQNGHIASAARRIADAWEDLMDFREGEMANAGLWDLKRKDYPI